MNERPTRVIEADLARPEHQAAIILMVDAYAGDPMGHGESLSRVARMNLIAELRQHPTLMVFLAYQETEPVGIAVCFREFSTFAAKPLLHIADYFVYSAYRGTGVGRLILETIEERARALGFYRLTLEVREDNERGKAISAAAGFSPKVQSSDGAAIQLLAKELS